MYAAYFKITFPTAGAEGVPLMQCHSTIQIYYKTPLDKR